MFYCEECGKELNTLNKLRKWCYECRELKHDECVKRTRRGENKIHRRKVKDFILGLCLFLILVNFVYANNSTNASLGENLKKAGSGSLGVFNGLRSYVINFVKDLLPLNEGQSASLVTIINILLIAGCVLIIAKVAKPVAKVVCIICLVLLALFFITFWIPIV